MDKKKKNFPIKFYLISFNNLKSDNNNSKKNFVSYGFTIQRVEEDFLAAISFPTSLHWSPICKVSSDFAPNFCWNAFTPKDLFPTSTQIWPFEWKEQNLKGGFNSLLIDNEISSQDSALPLDLLSIGTFF